MRDRLTELADRAAFCAQLGAAMQGAREGAALLVINLARFRAVNDALGYSAGDAVLRLASKRLLSALRPGDIAGRVGSDEFAVLLAAPSGEAAAQTVAARLVDLLARPYLISGQVAQISANIGIALSSAEPVDADTMLRRADLALHQAKSEGAGRIGQFAPELQTRAEARRELEQALRAALTLRELELFYQPQITLASNRLASFEALLRWRRPGIGLVPPAQFIPLAEEIGLIVEFGAWVMRTAAAECARWPAPLGVAVNVSARQFRAGTLVRTVSTALEAAGLAGDRLELEITESTLMESTDGNTLAQLRAIKALGVKVSLDDFGTGHSSLSQLRSFPFDRIKIDRSFADDLSVLRAVTAIGGSLGMRTTAEGIETVEQLAGIKAEGCTEAQGYLLGRPAPASSLPAFIERAGLRDTSGASEP